MEFPFTEEELRTTLRKGFKRMALLSREQIVKADDLKSEDVEVPEWGGTVRVRAMTGSERDKLEESCIVKKKDGSTDANMKDFRAKLVARTVVDENGHLIFNDGDVRILGNKSAQALSRVAEVASRLSGLTPEDIQELTEDFDDAQSDGSTSD